VFESSKHVRIDGSRPEHSGSMTPSREQLAHHGLRITTYKLSLHPEPFWEEE